MLVPPSPKFHDHPVTVPVEVSVNRTVNGTTPLMGEAVNEADGGDTTVMRADLVSVSLLYALLTVSVTV